MNDIQFAQFAVQTCGIQAEIIWNTNTLVLSHKDKLLNSIPIDAHTTVLDLRDAITRARRLAGLTPNPVFINGICIRCGVSEYINYKGIDRLARHREGCPHRITQDKVSPPPTQDDQA